MQLTVNLYDFLANKKLPREEKTLEMLAKLNEYNKKEISAKEMKKKLQMTKADWNDQDSIVYPGSQMMDIFLQATDFERLFETDIPKDDPNDPVDANVKYWEKVFANATTDAHKLFKSQKNKMYIESFEEHLRKILRYRNTAQHSSDNKYRMDGSAFKYDNNDFILILFEDIIEDYKAAKKFKGKLTLEKVNTMGFWCFNAGNSFR